MGLRGPLPRKAAPPANYARPLRRVPPPPSGLSKPGRDEWRRIGEELGPKGRNTLARVHLGILLDLCRAVDDADVFRETWQREGMTVESKGRPFPHPAIGSEREARRSINQLRRELGATPASAARVSALPAQVDEDDDEFGDIE